MIIEPNIKVVSYTGKIPRYNGTSDITGKSRIGVIESMIETIYEEADEMKREQNHKYEEDEKNNLI